MCLRTITTVLWVFGAAELGLAEVVTSEFSSLPTDEGWELLGSSGELTTWLEDGVYYQNFANNCEPGPVCGTEAFTRSIDVFNGQPNWFYEYRVSATGDSTEIPAGAPSGLSAFNAAGNLYHCVVSSDKIKLSGGPNLPILFLDVQPGDHVIRLELFNDPPPATFHWYVDSAVALEGLAKSIFPDFDSRIVWVGRTWMQPTVNAWSFIRAGDIPIEASADFNSDGEVDSFELFYIDECIQRSADGEPAAPSCAWADVTGNDNAVTCDDWQFVVDNLWSGPANPPTIPACLDPNPIPAASDWGVTILLLLTLTAGTVAFRHHNQPIL